MSRKVNKPYFIFGGSWVIISHFWHFSWSFMNFFGHEILAPFGHYTLFVTGCVQDYCTTTRRNNATALNVRVRYKNKLQGCLKMTLVLCWLTLPPIRPVLVATRTGCHLLHLLSRADCTSSYRQLLRVMELNNSPVGLVILKWLCKQ